MKLFSSTIFIIIIFMLFSCGPAKKPMDPKFDDSLYEMVDKGFYKGKKDGKFYIKTMTIEKVDTSKKMVYYYQEVPNIDIPSFNRLMHAGYYAKDKNHVYIWETSGKGEIVTILPGADSKTFTSIGYRWGKDTNSVFYESNIVKGLNPAEIALVCYEQVDSSLIYVNYIRDNDQLFYHNTEVKVPAGIDLLKIYCKEDLLGNAFLAIEDKVYIVEKGTMVPY